MNSFVSQNIRIFPTWSLLLIFSVLPFLILFNVNFTPRVFVANNGMPGNKYNCNPGTPRTRLERLLRERELRKFNKSLNDAETELSTNDPCSPDAETSTWFNDEDSLEANSAARVSFDGCESQDFRISKQRLLVVANRLPVSAVRRGDDSWQLEISVGGLVSALLGVKEFDTRWIGWAGVNVPDEIGQKALTKALAEKRCIPVFLDEEIVHQYYNGYCNNILWPLFHYLGLPQEDRLATTRSFQSQFDAYKKANQMFADVIYEHYEEDDVVWCHDYHLMFLPKCLKEHNSKMKVGWFLHTPFPSSEIHRTLPSRSELLRSVLAADLVGFHTYDYARHFLSACTRILGIEGTPEGVEDQGKLTRVAAFPIGIDSDRFIRALALPQVQDHMKELKERFAGRKVMLGVDRLDMIKGIPQKILAFEKFLEENPGWRDKVVLLQIAVPTRTDVPEYQKLTSQVHEIVGRINGRFGTLTAVPIHHLDRSLDFHALCALYAVTDVALVTSLRDGMNLVSYEFVACQASKKGVLILSEFAGAAQSLGAGAILVNPWNVTEVASSIGYALNMPANEREKRHHHNFMHVTTHTSQEWAATFISELNDTIVEAQLRTIQIPPLLPIEVAVDRYSQSNNRLLILGFNATLTEPVDTLGRKGSQIKELDPKLRPDLQDPLKKLCDDPKTTIVVLSGSDRSVLDDNFGDYNLWLAAENGMFLRVTEGEWMTTMPENLNMEWVDSVKHVFEYFTERTPRSHFELRETSVIWNYKYADVEFGRLQARDLLQHLWIGPISNASLDVVQGSRSVEVRSVGVTKGAAIDRILGEIVHNKGMKEPIDYVLCIGHFLAKDEDIYTFFEPELPSEVPAPVRPHIPTPVGTSVSKLPVSKSGSRAAHLKKQRSMSTIERNTRHPVGGGGLQQSRVPDRISLQEGSSVLDLQGDNYFSCSVARKRSNARYLLGSSDDVVKLLRGLADS
ncbi:alpha,alpha-trehalose-phosphate synthase [UDP-forming] 1-like [Durio zibethinus]|uniref:alpha,alpha-trehalose-phosphate synthase (UDP-forming) n=1 Tax=Durio zibethinus TaxID=66656 RepID=A0A6P5WJR6_DURZI|nr:alpha,alpha-trehalose-phosphate synthase [UDP-forming] 1-like [Durio zibethinus]